MVNKYNKQFGFTKSFSNYFYKIIIKKKLLLLFLSYIVSINAHLVLSLLHEILST